MKQSATEGRTVLFVSHSMQAVQSLCTKAILLEKGRIVEEGNIDKVATKYMQKIQKGSKAISKINHTGEGERKISIKNIYSYNGKAEKTDKFRTYETFGVSLGLDTFDSFKDLRLDINIVNFSGSHIAVLTKNFPYKDANNKKIKLLIEKLPLAPGNYYSNISIYADEVLQDRVSEAFAFEVIQTENVIEGAHDIFYGELELDKE